MAQVEVKLNYAAVGKILKSKEVEAECSKHASRIRNSLGYGYTSDTKIGRVRAVAEVRAYSYEARRDNVKNNTLLKAVRS